mmetsp:Transcript_37089/g.94791  ORF Transcript_37089/g.94791 Transcript_37089/m.94791 type:complete len:83 (-) Transcript_37089:110-358(-)|eukprot:jgi/Tetstr1/420639/TSEL_011727.t1
MTLWTLVQASMMFANGFAVLNNERFLERYGWGYSALHGQQAAFSEAGKLKKSIIGFLHASSYLRVPLIVLNLIVIFVKVLFG